MVNPLFSIGGIASGLDTAGIIDQLMSLERAPIRQFQASQASLRSVDNAWTKVVGKLSAFRTALDDVRKGDSLSKSTKASSDNEDAVKITGGSGSETGSLSFSVEALASRHRVGLSGTFASPSGLVGAGTVELFDETGGSAGSITTDGTTTLSDLASQITGLGVGVEAKVLKVSEDNYQLVLSSKSTGAESQFSLTSDLTSLGTSSTLSTGADAHLKVGNLDVYRPSNTFSDLVAGATIQLKKVTTSDVTVSVERDVEASAAKIKKLVTSANDLLGQLAKDTAYNAETKAAGVLQGDSLARQLAFDIREQFTQTLAGGDISYVGQIGISLNRSGTIDLDEAKLTKALTEQPDAVSRFVSQTLTGSSKITATHVAKGTGNSSFAMNVTQAAAAATRTGSTYVSPSGSNESFTITTPSGSSVAVTIDIGMTTAQAIGRINAALEAAGSDGLRATVGDDGAGGEAISLASTGYGSSVSFTVSGSAQGLDGTFTGVDVIADFGSGAVTGSGRSIVGDGAAAGLTLKATGGVGTYNMEFSTGFGGLLDRYMSTIEGTDGRIQSQRDSISGRIKDFDKQIEAFEQRMVLREGTLRAQFTSLEVAMSRLQSQGQWLAGALGSLGGGG